MIEITNLYTDYTPTSHWTKDDEDSEANIITIATALHHERMKNNNRLKIPMTTSVHPRLDLCNFVQGGKLNTVEVGKYVF